MSIEENKALIRRYTEEIVNNQCFSHIEVTGFGSGGRRRVSA